ncbi:hypothetical protein BY996DRAFT_7353737, partial [Phakopsora pachyrhizi]
MMTNRIISRSSTDQQQLLVEDFLDDSISSNTLTVLEDCQSQSGTPILSELFNRTLSRRRALILITLDSDPRLFLDSSFLKGPEGPVAAKGLRTLDLNDCSELVVGNGIGEGGCPIDLIEDRTNVLINELLESATNGSITVIIDSVVELFKRSPSTRKTFKFLRNLLKTLSTSNSRLVVLHSPHLFQTILRPSGSDSLLDPSSILRSSSLSTSILYLRIHPTSILDCLTNSYGIPLPERSKLQLGTCYNLRFFRLLNEISSTCDPYNLFNSYDHDGHKDDDDEEKVYRPVPEALLIRTNNQDRTSNLGSCLIEWTSRNVQACNFFQSTSISPLTQATSFKSSSTRLGPIRRGLEAVKLEDQDFNVNDNKDADGNPLRMDSYSFRLTGVHAGFVVTQKIHNISTNNLQKKDIDDADGLFSKGLTFNLSLTEKQRMDRDTVNLPFLPRRNSKDGSVIEAPGEIYDGSFKGQKGTIEYEFDSADDFDEEEPED